MQPHSHVKHPREILQAKRETKKQTNKVLYINELILEWVTNHVLASVILFDVALIVPLLAIPAPNTIKFVVGIVSSNWIQLWALPALQRSQNRTQAQNDAKAEADHETLTYLTTLQDQQMAELNTLKDLLAKLQK